MRSIARLTIAIAMTSAIVFPSNAVNASECDARIAALKRDMAKTNDPASLENAMLAVVDAVECGPEDAGVAKKLFTERLLASAEEARRQGRGDAADALAAKAAAQHVSWRAARAYGDSLSRQRQYAKAAEYFQEALNLLGEDKSTGAPRKEELRQLTLKADEAYHLAAAGTDQRKGQDGVLVRSITRSGAPGGVLSRAANRGIEAVRLPMPILFRYDSDEFTPVGEQAAQELRDILRASPPARINVTGHTDRIGSDEYNQKLSERRARRVAQYLKENGVASTFVATGKGMRSPRILSEGHGYSQMQIDELNRRVEFEWN